METAPEIVPQKINKVSKIPNKTKRLMEKRIKMKIDVINRRAIE